MHAGGANLRKQIENVRLHGVTPVVAINAFPEDFESEYAAIAEIADSLGVRSAVSTHFRDGGAGATELAEAVVAAADEPSQFRFLYPSEATLREKIETIATQVYGADGVDYLPAAARGLDLFEANGLRWLSPLHRQDPPLHLLESDAQGSADPDGACRFARSGPRPVPASSMPSAAICGRCPDWVAIRRPRRSTSTSTGTSSGSTEVTGRDHGAVWTAER